MFGGALQDNDAFTLSLLTNPELMAMPKHITKSYQVSRIADLIIWRGESATAQYFALFNATDADSPMVLDLAAQGVDGGTIWDIWRGEPIAFSPQLTFDVPKHGVVLLKVSG